MNTLGSGGEKSTLHSMNADCAPAKLKPPLAPLSPPGGPTETWNVSTGSALSS